VKRAVSMNRTYLALFFPFLAADRWTREHSEREGRAPPPDAPLIFIHKQKNARRIAATSPEALALGLVPGLALADARARVPTVNTRDHDPAGDARLITQIADWCDRYTPMVALDPQDGLILDITGCGEAEGLAADAAMQLKGRGLCVYHALGQTPDRARALARFPALPVAALEAPEESITALHRAGLTSIAALAARPRAVLAARFGAAMTTKLARVLGEEDPRITPRREPPALFVIQRFAEPIARTPDVLSTLEALVAQAALLLAARGVGGTAFEASLYRSDGAIHRLAIATGSPTRDPALVLRLFRERIDALADPLDPGFGYDAIRLDVPQTGGLTPTQFQLEGGEQSVVKAGVLIDRLGVRLGAARIRRFGAGDSHIPEQAAFAFPANAPPLPLPWARPEPGEPPLRPLHLFDPPHRIEVMAEVPDGPPRRFRWRRTVHDVSGYEGPERIAAEWWRRRSMAGLTRDYFRVEDVRGRRFWVFRHGLYGAEKMAPDWYLHGVFA
jgi:protein ImuB